MAGGTGLKLPTLMVTEIIDFVLGNWGLNTKFKATPSRTADHVS